MKCFTRHSRTLEHIKPQIPYRFQRTLFRHRINNYIHIFRNA